MTPLLFIFIFYAAVESSAVVKPVVTFTPDWTNIFIYESVTITCNVGSTEHKYLRYYWFKDAKPIKEQQPHFTIQFADDSDLGEYQCHTNTSQKSDPARLGVINNLLILQRPLVIYEGDPLTLRCHSFPGLNATNMSFYKNGTLLQFSVTDDKLHFTKVHHDATGTYHCTKQIYHEDQLKNMSAETQISVEGKVRKHDKRQTTPSFHWIPVLVVLPIALITGLLLFMCRHKLSPRIRGGPQNYPATESGVQSKEEEDVNYSYIDADNLQTAIPAPKHQCEDFSITYSLVTHAGSSDTPEGTSARTVYEVIRLE